MEEINVNQISTELLTTQNLVDCEIDKDTWIYAYGSHQLQEVRSFGYECEGRYQQERLKTEYPGFKINYRSTSEKLDFPPLYAIQESLKWQNAYVAKQIIDGEVIAILQGRGYANDNYLGWIAYRNVVGTLLRANLIGKYSFQHSRHHLRD